MAFLPASSAAEAAAPSDAPAAHNPKFSSIEYYRQLLRESKPRLQAPAEKSQIPAWRDQVATRLREILGINNCQPAELKPRTTDLGARRGYRLHRVVFSSEPHADVPGLLLIPDGVSAENPAPAVLCLHGNVPGAKEELAGESTPSADLGLGLYHDDYARQFAQKGVIAFAIDLRDSGERRHYEDYKGSPLMIKAGDLPGEPWRQVSGLMAIPLGRTYSGLCVFDAMRAIDYMLTRPEVNPSALGCVGFSAGATYAAWLTVLDRRIKYAGLSGTSAGNRRGLANNYHRRRPSGVIPGFYVYLDSDLCLAAMAPTPMILARDWNQRRPEKAPEAPVVRQAYEGFGAGAGCQFAYGQGEGHVWHQDVVVPWVMERLRAIELERRVRK
ncbi:MAG: alpha/beta hydrolase family protein [Opitutaceae bacterium]